MHPFLWRLPYFAVQILSFYLTRNEGLLHTFPRTPIGRDSILPASANPSCETEKILSVNLRFYFLIEPEPDVKVINRAGQLCNITVQPAGNFKIFFLI